MNVCFLVILRYSANGKIPGSIKTSTDLYDNVTLANYHKIPTTEEERAGNQVMAHAFALVGHHFCEDCHSTVADGLGIYFAIYPKDNFSCLASFEQKHFVPVSTVLWTTD